ncbi:3-oxoacyl-(acyl-carrier-protein) synthase [Muriicola jejuensis]|uniref:3-oxoacyl-[acyl-carrier-protein] synthase 1 n=1 Tax=Muriicola jejuensis TaxID=504488 RepID=A0A6P0UDI9_9FLAO|nr:beta-ketoacyl-[acyl-carrier-protein] synthase family protein [Muriicola jejuensis]NER11331.1 beta-ketoacyl-[acyl-carrier-protein] synthase family protein [Muriicola jejuensis]SMP21395.1 3-oxoacyl-(acyl-carrier-protein) synthase [Muriicola jejuensis]
MSKRVVITGLGVCAPNGVDLRSFTRSLREGKSGIAFQSELKKLNFGCQIAGKPTVETNYLNNYFTSLEQRGLNSSGLVYGVISGMDAWRDAGLEATSAEETDWESGIIFGTGILGVDKFREAIHLVDEGNTRRLGSTTVIQTMASGISAFLGGKLGLGNQVTTNSSACTTGTEGVLMAYERIASGKARRMLAGSCSDSGPYVWGGFDAMRILPRNFNEDPERGSRPMSQSAAGFVPGSGAGALVLESLESAQERKAHIYAEVLGGAVNCGGQRSGGTMTAPNDIAVQRCIREALDHSGIAAGEIDSINGHLTATAKDPVEIDNWCKALGLQGGDFPYINSFKSTVGHCLAAAGSIECVGTVLQFAEGMVFGNVNCEDIHPDILQQIHRTKIPQETLKYAPKVIAKASFGFGDVNACIIFKEYKP